MTTVLRGLAGLAVLATVSACTQDPPELRDVRIAALPLTATEVLRVNGEALSLTSYVQLQSEFPTLSGEELLWLASAAIAACTRRGELRPWVDDKDPESLCLDLAVYARGQLVTWPKPGISAPPRTELLTRINAALAASKVEKNAELLKQIH